MPLVRDFGELVPRLDANARERQPGLSTDIDVHATSPDPQFGLALLADRHEPRENLNAISITFHQNPEKLNTMVNYMQTMASKLGHSLAKKPNFAGKNPFADLVMSRRPFFFPTTN